MRVSQDEKRKSRARIVEGAARLVRERGLDGTSVADVMAAAGLTNGGFYRHFESKDALVAAAIEAAFDQMLPALKTSMAAPNPTAATAAYRAHYLSEGHVANPGLGCPVAAIGGSVDRASDAARGAFGGGVERLIATLAEGMAGSTQASRAAAIREFARLVGAVVIARSCEPEMAGTVLEACRAG